MIWAKSWWIVDIGGIFDNLFMTLQIVIVNGSQFQLYIANTWS